jgi:RNA polymerase sigma-70 factor (ECF subfamily)
LKGGDIAVLRTLVELYEAQANQIAVLITQDRAMEQDIVQNAFLRSYKHIAQFDSSRPFRPWFYRMVTNAALKVGAKPKCQITLDIEEDETYQYLVEYLDGHYDRAGGYHPTQ